MVYILALMKYVEPLRPTLGISRVVRFFKINLFIVIIAL